ncbi:MAG: bifunctional 3,4-dihydroxy-2-butanone-4-phosphate synthase/GTP cyclohydrolase II [Nitrospirae bacterium]|nr:bifunctional 3,4-dihydroxy-2-butanone-4-phosphate synthase/GTP cyclohydrolase II [Nitrospirota bacterium]MCL5237495.1 bifunctional 3,4-dihydroxy-2-butanone-4-phosphate synthase/GTP cyclohydrolase II [Nitrospirota bacterium]
MEKYKFNTIEDALEDITKGKMVILVDDEDRENEGDLCMAAEKVTPEAINFMAKYGRGLICLSLTPQRVEELKLHMMSDENTSSFGTAFTVSIEAKKGVTTGISAHDRAVTIQAAINPQIKAEDLARPGHVFPLKAKPGGVLQRAGQTEGSVDLARLAGMNPSGVICEIMNDDGTMARVPQLMEFAKEHKVKIITVKDLIQHRMRTERFVKRIATVQMPTKHGGDFTAIAYANDVDPNIHIALVKGDLKPDDKVLVRVHSECLTGDVFGSKRCDCGDQLQRAMEIIKKEGRGVILYMRQEGRGIGLANKLRAYELQDKGLDTVEANLKLGFKPDLRDYGIGAQILVDLGVRKMRLITNNPKKIVGLEGYGLKVVERVPAEVTPHDKNIIYLQTKKKKMGHMIENV